MKKQNPPRSKAKRFITLLVCWTALLLSHKISAQSTCPAALNLLSGTSYTDSLINKQEEWFSFTATRTTADVKLIDLAPSQAGVTSMQVFSGTCSSLTQIGIDIDTIPPTDSLEISLSGLSTGNTYFIKVRRDDPTSCCACSFGTFAPFQLIVINDAFITINGAFGDCYQDAANHCTVTVCVGGKLCFSLDQTSQGLGGTATWAINGSSCPTLDTVLATDTVCCVYPTVGTFNARVKHIDPLGNIAISPIATINVVPPPNASLTISPTPSCIGDTVCITVNSTIPSTSWNSGTFQWDVDGTPYNTCVFFANCSNTLCFPDNNMGTSLLSMGTHTVTVIVNNGGGCIDTVSQTFDVGKPDLSFTMNNHCNTEFIANSTCENAFASWSWNFGDPSSGTLNTDTGEVVYHTFTIPGANYTITLTAIDIFGNTYLYQQQITAPPAVNSTIAGYAVNNCGDTPFSYNAPCDSNVVYSWDVFGGTILSTSPNGCTVSVNWTLMGGYLILNAFDTIMDCGQRDTLFVGPCCHVGDTAFDATHPLGTIYFNNDTASKILQNPLYIAAGFVNGTTFRTNNLVVINGLLLIDTNFRFFVTNNIHPSVNAIIDVMNTRTFTVDSSRIINQCDYMWEGIRVSDPSALVRIIRSSKLEYAKNCIHSYSGGRYFMENSKMNNCVRGIVVEEYNLPNPSVIRGSVMDMSSSPPFYQALPALPSWEQKTIACITISKNQRIEIGDTTFASYQNRFINVYNGIQIDNSKVYAYHNRFANIVNDPLVPVPTGYGIDATGIKTQQYPQTVLFIGSGTASVLSRNNFFACTDGIRVTNICTSNIHGNFFQQISDVGIDINSDIRPIRIFNNTMAAGSVPFKIGIRVTNCTNANVVIQSNTIAGLAASANNLAGTGILVQSTNPSAFRSRARVLNNTISRSRNGIWMLNLIPTGSDTIFVRSNIVNFNTNWNLLGLPTISHSGIRVQSCTKLFADTNNITTSGTNFAAGSDTLIRGFFVENSMICVIDGNVISKMQSGVLAKDFVFATIYPCNDISRCIHGFNFVGSGSVGAFVFIDQIPIPASTSFAPTGNIFLNPLGNDIDGQVSTPVKWYYTTPPNSNCIGLTPTFNSNLPLCGTIYFLPPLSPGGQRAANVGAGLSGAAQANDADATYSTKVHSLRWLRNHPNWITLGLQDDTTYQNFYSNYINSSIGELNQVDELLRSDSGVVASSVNASVNSTNQKEQNKQTVNNIYLRSWYLQQYVFTPQDSAMLLSIALQNPFYAGEAVYDARVMLGVDVEEYGNRSASRMAQPQTQQGDNLKLYPNPTADAFTIEYAVGENQTATYQVMTISGQLILSDHLQSGTATQQVNTAHLQQGIYLISVFVNGEMIDTKKLIIIRQ